MPSRHPQCFPRYSGRISIAYSPHPLSSPPSQNPLDTKARGPSPLTFSSNGFWGGREKYAIEILPMISDPCRLRKGKERKPRRTIEMQPFLRSTGSSNDSSVSLEGDILPSPCARPTIYYRQESIISPHGPNPNLLCTENKSLSINQSCKIVDG